MEDGGTIPIQRTAAPVQLGQLLTALQSDTREDLKVFLREYSKGLDGKGAEGFNESIRYWEPAYKNTALANDATLGQEPRRDIQRVLRGQQRTFAALNADEGALQELITNFNTTAEAFAVQDAACPPPSRRCAMSFAMRSRRWPRSTTRCRRSGRSPSTRCRRPVPRRRRSASLPFIRQARLLMRRSELRGLAAELRRRCPTSSGSTTGVPVLTEARALSACTNGVLVPFIRSPIPGVQGPDGEHGNSGQQVRYQIQRGFVGLSGESRLSDGNNQFFHFGRAGAYRRPAGVSARSTSRHRGARTCPARPRSRPTSTRRGAGVAAWQRQPPPRLGDHPLEGQAAHPCGAQLRQLQVEHLEVTQRELRKAKRRLAGEGDPQAPGRLPRGGGGLHPRHGDGRLHPVQPAAALPDNPGGGLPPEGPAARRAGRHPGQGRAVRVAGVEVGQIRSSSRTAGPR